MIDNKQTEVLWQNFQRCCNQAHAIENKLQKDSAKNNGHQRISARKRGSLEFQLQHLCNNVIPQIANSIDNFFPITTD